MPPGGTRHSCSFLSPPQINPRLRLWWSFRWVSQGRARTWNWRVRLKANQSKIFHLCSCVGDVSGVGLNPDVFGSGTQNTMMTRKKSDSWLFLSTGTTGCKTTYLFFITFIVFMFTPVYLMQVSKHWWEYLHTCIYLFLCNILYLCFICIRFFQIQYLHLILF